MAVSNVDERRLTSFSVVADPHVQPRTFRSAPPSGLVMLVPRRCSGGALPRVRYGGLGRRERGRGGGAGAPRSGERRGGQEGGCRWVADYSKKKIKNGRSE